jgi:hypothetical protein
MSMPSAAALVTSRPLTGLEVQSGEPTCQLGDALHIEPHHASQALGGPREALEAHIHPGALAGLVLFDDIREHAVAGGQIKALHHLMQQSFQPHDGVQIVAGRVEADDHVTTAVAQSLQDREQDLLLVIARAVGLDAGAEVPRVADGDGALPWRAWKGIENPLGDEGQLRVAHHLDERRDHLAAEAVAVAPQPFRAPVPQQDIPHLGHGEVADLGAQACVQRACQGLTHPVVDPLGVCDHPQRQARQSLTRLRAQALVPRAAHGSVTLLEPVGQNEGLQQFLMAHLY